MIRDAGFSISVIGDLSCETYRGDFRAVKFLTHRQQLLLDQRRRDILGNNSESASPRAQNQAHILASVFVRITEAPTWWKESNSGLDLIDDNVLIEVFENAMRIENETVSEIRAKAERAQESIKSMV